MDQSNEQEKIEFAKTIKAYREYGLYGLNVIKSKKAQYDSTILAHQQERLNPTYYKKLTEIGKAIQINSFFLKSLTNQNDLFFDQSELVYSMAITEFEMDKIKGTLKQFVRDWSSKGSNERDLTYTPILKVLKLKFPKPDKVKILVPGAGLGRLAFDIANQGYVCEGNEFSFYMLLASNFILNKCTEVDQYTIHPYCLSFSNHLSMNNQIQGVKLPDILPVFNNTKSEFSMTAGDFLEVYSTDSNINKWDSVVTCFFIDTAHNVASYIDLIHKILKPGGLWINIGPLLYHFDSHKDDSLELTWEEIKYYFKNLFTIESEKMISTTYITTLNSMLTYQYTCVFTVAVKT